jgi:AcrR family transcriptional regulator
MTSQIERNVTSCHQGYAHAVARWEPDAAGRLKEAAEELFLEAGYEKTTVEQIAARAGVTARTFFRHFADKREVLFSGSEQLAKFVGHAIAGADEALGPLEAVAAAAEAVAPTFEQPLPALRKRRALIAAHPELRERELSKLTALTTAAEGALVERGVPRPQARLVAETGLAVFRVAIERWVESDGSKPLLTHLRKAFAELKTLLRR